MPIKGGKERGGSRVVTESLAEVREAIDAAGAEDEAAAELEGVPSELVLAVAGGAGAFAAAKIIAAKNVKQVGGAEISNSVGLALFVDEQREIDAGFFPKNARVVAIAEADGHKRSTFVEEGLLVFAQLRDMLAAKDSAIVAKKNDDHGVVLPQRT